MAQCLSINQKNTELITVKHKLPFHQSISLGQLSLCIYPGHLKDRTSNGLSPILQLLFILLSENGILKSGHSNAIIRYQGAIFHQSSGRNSKSSPGASKRTIGPIFIEKHWVYLSTMISTLTSVHHTLQQEIEARRGLIITQRSNGKGKRLKCKSFVAGRALHPILFIS